MMTRWMTSLMAAVTLIVGRDAARLRFPLVKLPGRLGHVTCLKMAAVKLRLPGLPLFQSALRPSFLQQIHMDWSASAKLVGTSEAQKVTQSRVCTD